MATRSSADDAEFVRFGARMCRIAATPRAAAAQYQALLRSDVRQALPLIQAPTLVLHPAEYAPVPLELGQYVAEHIEGATLVEVPGSDYSITRANGKVAVEAIAEFLTGDRPQVEVDRILTTVLFTDIVGSTQRVASLGDQAWRTVLDTHDRLVREELRHYRGREINTTGDGFVANFDGPARAIRCARQLSRRLASSASSCGLACIPESARCVARTWADWPSILRPALAQPPDREKCSYHPR